MAVRIVSFLPQFKNALYDHLATNLGDAAFFYRADIQAAIGIQGPPRSSPGNPPHVDTGDLQASIDSEVDAAFLVARVSSDSDHALAMELGTQNVAARPYFVATLIANADKYAQEICKP